MDYNLKPAKEFNLVKYQKEWGKKSSYWTVIIIISFYKCVIKELKQIKVDLESCNVSATVFLSVMFLITGSLNLFFSFKSPLFF